MSRFTKYARAIVLSIMFGMLIVSFGLWGVGDMVRMGRTDPIVAEVGDVKITAREVRERFNRMLEQAQARSGRPISLQQGVEFGLHWRALEEQVKAVTIDLAAKELGVVVSDEQIRQAIAEIPTFAGPGGRFDPNAYQAALRRAGLSEAAFISDMRRELSAVQIVGAIQGSAKPPAALTDALYRYRREKRVAELFILPFDSVRELPAPTPEQLKAFYETNKTRFQVPEYRTLSYVVLSTDDVAGEIALAEDQVRRAYNERLAEFAKPEMRDVDQVVAASEDEARRIAELVRTGKSLEEAAKEILSRDGVIKLGAIAKKDLPAELAEPVFGQKQGEAGGPYRSAFGWHVARVNRIEAGETPSFEQLRPRIEEELKKEIAPDLLFRRVRDFDVALGRSDSLAEAAKAIEAPVHTVEAVNQQGGTPGGGRALASPIAQEIVRTAFTLREGQQSSMVDAPSGESFVVRVERIAPSRTPPLEEIEVQVRIAWQAAERQRLTEARAKEIVDRLNAVAAFETQARAAGQTVRVSRPVERSQNDRDAGLNADLVAELFTLAPGRSGARTIEGGVAILRVKEVIAADPAAGGEDAKQFAAEVGNSMAADVTQQVLGAFERRFGRKVNLQIFQQTFRTEQTQ
jgi:peptidyl-prolyl cis-trans isomerase D